MTSTADRTAESSAAPEETQEVINRLRPGHNRRKSAVLDLLFEGAPDVKRQHQSMAQAAVNMTTLVGQAEFSLVDLVCAGSGMCRLAKKGFRAEVLAILPEHIRKQLGNKHEIKAKPVLHGVQSHPEFSSSKKNRLITSTDYLASIYLDNDPTWFSYVAGLESINEIVQQRRQEDAADGEDHRARAARFRQEAREELVMEEGNIGEIELTDESYAPSDYPYGRLLIALVYVSHEEYRVYLNDILHAPESDDVKRSLENSRQRAIGLWAKERNITADAIEERSKQLQEENASDEEAD